jgi:hypothetical protein
MFTLDQVTARTVSHPQNVVVTLVCICIISVFPCLAEEIAPNNECIYLRPTAAVSLVLETCNNLRHAMYYMYL